jgi:hypothetical protein
MTTGSWRAVVIERHETIGGVIAPHGTKNAAWRLVKRRSRIMLRKILFAYGLSFLFRRFTRGSGRDGIAPIGRRGLRW